MLRRALLAAAASDRARTLLTATPAVRALVSRYVAGEGTGDAVRAARELRADGLLVTLDYLGEDTTSAVRAAAVATEYAALIEKLAAEGLTAGGAVEVSVKLTALGLMVGPDGPDGSGGPDGPDAGRQSAGGQSAGGPGTGGQGAGWPPDGRGEKIAAEHAGRIAAAAAAAGTTMTIDAEDHRTTDAALRVAAALRTRYPSVGSVVQSCLRRTENDARALAVPGVRVRLCKGAYSEPVSEAFTDAHDIDKAYARCLRVLMEGPGYPMIATHDPRLIRITAALALRREPASFEYQMLHGVRPDEQRRLADSGARVRVYVPYGGDWYGYLVRRLAERPANLALFLRSLAGTR